MGATRDDTDKVFLHGLVFYGYHGVGAAEKARGQRFIVDITMECDTRAAGASDNLEDAVDYVPVYDIAKEALEGESKDLIESVAEQIATRIFAETAASAVSISIKKPEVAIKGSILSYAGIQIYRQRQD
ncbi:MAG: dihydroneopterin aldolase [Chloroflexi bacterium]|nr:dihydroneopterin aldolase [Chloroflexota bacterium]